MLNDTDLRVFIKGANHYFAETTSVPAEIGVPYETTGNEAVMLDFSAIIGVTGNHTGCVFFTAPRAMILQLVRNFGEPDTSAPVTFRGQADARMPRGTPAFVIVTTWQGHRAHLVIAVRATS